MADQFNSGVNLPYPAASTGAIVEDAFGVLVNYQPNRYPLLERLPKRPLGSPSFNLVTDAYRPRVGTVTNGGSAVASGATTIAVGDSSVYDLGDVIEVGVGSPAVYEAMLVTATTSGTPDTITVTRGYAGTAAAAIPDGSSLFLLTNTRTGGEININAINRNPSVQEQYAQTVQHAYQVSGALASTANYVSGYGTPVQRDKWFCMKHVADDFEEALYYGRGNKLGSGVSRPAMKGLRSLIQTNNTANPTNAAAYKPSDMIRDLIQPTYDAGGAVSLLLVSTTFLTGLSVWGMSQVWLDAGATKFGVAIRTFSLPFLPDVEIMVAPLMKKGDALALAYGEVAIRMKRALEEIPRGRRGDAIEGDFLMEGAIELENESHHAYVSGITGWAKQS